MSIIEVQKVKGASVVFEALGNEVRLRVLKLIAQRGRMYCGEIIEQFHLSQPTMSHHLTKLVRAGVLMETKEGVKHCYTLNVEKLWEVGIDAKQFTAALFFFVPCIETFQSFN